MTHMLSIIDHIQLTTTAGVKSKCVPVVFEKRTIMKLHFRGTGKSLLQITMFTM